MATYIRKRKEDILRQALSKLEERTPIKATSPGSVARSFTEAISTELGDFYDVLDYNLAQSVLSTATGRALDLMGELYNIRRKTISNLAETDRQTGSFYFYIDSPYTKNIHIAKGTRVYTSVETFVGRQLGYETTIDTVIPAGRTKAYVGIKPIFSDGTFSAAKNTLTQHDLQSPPGVVVKCTNPKAIAPQQGYESDDNYRTRLIKSIRVASSGTLEAMRFAALSISGVRDVNIRQAPYGLGSVEVLVTPEETDVARTIMPLVIARLNEVRPVGVRMFVKQPSLLATDITANLIIKNISDTRVREAISNKATVGILRYLNSLLSGETLVYNKLIQSILEASESIVDVQITRYAPNGVEVVRKNYVPQEDEQIIPGRIVIDIAQ